MNKVTKTDKFTIRGAKMHAKADNLHDWVHEFLHTIGKNKEMAKGLKKRKIKNSIWWVGPLNFPLKELTRCCGTEKEMEFPQTFKSWEKRVGKMLVAIKNGWEPPVLIVNWRPKPILSIRDGNHRFEALRRSGKRKYWSIFWFDTKKDRQEFIKKYKNFL